MPHTSTESISCTMNLQLELTYGSQSNGKFSCNLSEHCVHSDKQQKSYIKSMVRTRSGYRPNVFGQDVQKSVT
eukprot:2829020-Prymnesium_polylepis.1